MNIRHRIPSPQVRTARPLSLLHPPEEVPVGDHGRNHMPAAHACPTPPPTPRKPGRWWLLHVVLAGEAAVIAMILLGRLLAAWLGMP
jgi:hypothetical protein